MAADFDFSSIRDEIEQAIVGTLPTEPGRRNKAVFEFCRHLQAIPALSVAKPVDLRNIALEWHSRALPYIDTKSPEETLVNFYRAWPKVKFPAGMEPLKQLFEEALAAPLPHCCERFSTYKVKVLIALCRKLHHHWQPEPFMLSCRKAGELFDVSHTTANDWLSLLTFDGVLTCQELGTAKTQRASRYFYLGD